MVEEAEEPHRQREKRMLRVYRLNSRVEELKGAVKAAAAREDYAAARPRPTCRPSCRTHSLRELELEAVRGPCCGAPLRTHQSVSQ